MLAAILVSMIGAGFSAHAGFASIDQKVPIAPVAAEPVGYDADDHFPGAAYFHVIEDGFSPAPGVTGTASLPDEPEPAIDPATDGSVVAARPFRLGGNAVDRERALQCLTTAIYYEAATEPDNGQRGVAQVILNRVRHPAFPATVCGVIYQGSDKRGCQFSYACDGSLARKPSSSHWARARRVAENALTGSVFAPVGMATHYHTFAVKPYWNRSLVMTGVFGAHFFHRWKGFWGTPAAFRQAHAGNEPVPGPRRAVATLDEDTLAAMTAPVAGLPAYASVAAPAAPAPKANVQPAYADSGTPVERPDLPESTILDRWKDSGKPLR